MNVISFHLKGKMGHFRRFYSNSSSLTYSIPPRTTICGILAGILGMERDSYYEEFSLENCDIAIALRSPIKKQIYKMNLLMVKSDKDLNGSQEFHSQTPTEMILPTNIRTDNIHYQIWVHHKKEEIMEALYEILGQADYACGYGSKYMPVSLGTAYNLGWLEYNMCNAIKGVKHTSEEFLEYDSVLPISLLKDIYIRDITDEGYCLIREEIPMEFDKNRRLTPNGIGDIVVNLMAKPIKAKVKEHIELTTNERIVWLQ